MNTLFLTSFMDILRKIASISIPSLLNLQLPNIFGIHNAKIWNLIFLAAAVLLVIILAIVIAIICHHKDKKLNKESKPKQVKATEPVKVSEPVKEDEPKKEQEPVKDTKKQQEPEMPKETENYKMLDNEIRLEIIKNNVDFNVLAGYEMRRVFINEDEIGNVEDTRMDKVVATEDVVPAEKEVEQVEEKEEVGISLKETLEWASKEEHGVNVSVDKKVIADHLTKKFGKTVEVNQRENAIKSGKLPLADTHYCLVKKIDKEKSKQRKCFIFVYETEGGVLLLVNSIKKYMDTLRKKHPLVRLSSFPKSKDKWYSIIIDTSFTKDEILSIIDTVKELNELPEEKDQLKYLTEKGLIK